MKRTKIFTAAIAAMAMLAVGSTVTSCSEDENDPVGKQYQADPQQQGGSVKKATQARFVIQMEFGHETFKACDVVLTYKDFDGIEHKEDITQNNVTEGKGYKYPDRIHYYFKKEISTSKVPASIEYHVDMNKKAGASLGEGEIGIRNSACIYGLDSNGYVVCKRLRPTGTVDEILGFSYVDSTFNVDSAMSVIHETNAFKTYRFDVTADGAEWCRMFN